MTAPEIPRLDTIFCAAIDIPAPEDRDAYIAGACANDKDLRGRIEKLVAAHFRAGNFLEASSLLPSVTRDAPLSERPGTVIGPYKLLQQIGEGGMGVVWMAEQTEPVKRKVALKVIKPGMDSRQVIARFEAERQALAMMDHVNIARVFDGGTTGEVGSRQSAVGSQERGSGSLPTAECLLPTGGRPYFVMELVHGVPITKYCDDNHLTPRERLELFVPVCQAIQHAHQKGIIHRDIKPSNVMVTLYDGKPVPKVIDFGVAKATEQKLTERTLFTQYGTMVGTLEYMSPEQAEMSALGVDTRSDIYSLGVLLYELLTGSTPLTHKRMKEAAYAEILRMIKEEEPPKPSTRLSDSSEALASISANRHTEPAKLTKLVKGELDWIVMKCLDKDRNRRYETAKDFAADVQRYLDDEPVQACPPSRWYRFRKFARRNKVAITTIALVALALMVGTAISTWQAIRASLAESHAGKGWAAETSERQRAEEEKRTAERRLYTSDLRLAQRAWEDSRVGRLLELLDGQRPQHTGGVDLRGFEWHYWHRLCHKARLTSQGPTAAIYCLAISPDGKYLATAGGDTLPVSQNQPGEIQVRDTGSARVIFTLAGHTFGVRSVAFSPDGRRLVSVANSFTPGKSNGETKVWDLATRRESLSLLEIDRRVPSAVFSAAGKYLALATNISIKNEAIKIHDATNGELVRTLKGDSGAVRALACHPSEQLLASAGDDGIVRLWDLHKGTERRILKGHDRGVVHIVFSADGRRLASAGIDYTVRIWDVAGEAPLGTAPSEGKSPEPLTLRGHREGLGGLAFSADGLRLASASFDQTVKLWDNVAGRELATFKGHTNMVRTAVFTADGRVVSAGYDGTIRVWDEASGQEALTIAVPAGASRVVFSPDGKRLAGGGTDGMVRLWDAATGQEVQRFQNPRWYVGGLTFSPDGRHLATPYGQFQKSGAVSIRDAATWHEVLLLKGHSDLIFHVAFSPDGKRLATAGYDGKVILWDASSGHELLVLKGHAEMVLGVVFSPNGQRLASSGGDRAVRIWDAGDGRELLSLGDAKSMTYGIAFSPDGKLLAGASQRGKVIVWDAATGQELLDLKGHTNHAVAVAFTPDGRRLASAGADRTVRLWDTLSGQELLTLKEHTEAVRSVAFSPDGRYLASAGDDKTIRIRDARPLGDEPQREN